MADEEEREDDSGADDDSDDLEVDRPPSPPTGARSPPRPPAAGGWRGHVPLHEPPKTGRAPLQAGRQAASGQVSRGGPAQWVCWCWVEPVSEKPGHPCRADARLPLARWAGAVQLMGSKELASAVWGKLSTVDWALLQRGLPGCLQPREQACTRALRSPRNLAASQPCKGAICVIASVDCPVQDELVGLGHSLQSQQSLRAGARLDVKLRPAAAARMGQAPCDRTACACMAHGSDWRYCQSMAASRGMPPDSACSSL